MDEIKVYKLRKFKKQIAKKNKNKCNYHRLRRSYEPEETIDLLLKSKPRKRK
jgi:hypothetical protein